MDSYLNQRIDETASTLKEAGIENARLEARIIFAHLLGCEIGNLSFCSSDPELLNEDKLKEIVSARLSHRPLDKILGIKGFYKYDFKVSEDVLSPRPDTEVLVEAASKYLKQNPESKILDLGTGSGCIILSLLSDYPQAKGVALDVSRKALEIAKMNAYQLGVDKQVTFVEGSWFDKDVVSKLGRNFDIIVSNPPYIPSSDISKLEKEVREHDPLRALDGGEDGLRDYRQISFLIHDLLIENGLLFLEVGIYQSAEVVKIFEKAGLELVKILKDLGGIERCVILKK